MTYDARPTEIQPRDYQTTGLDLWKRQRQRTRRNLIVKATGTGKTVFAAFQMQEIRKTDPRPVLFLAHREELLLQTVEKAQRVMPEAVYGIERAESRAPDDADVIVASVLTIGRKNSERLAWLEKRGVSAIFVDEAHHAAAESYLTVLRRFGAFDTRRTEVIGLTATPTRLDNKQLSGSEEAIFEAVAYRYGLVQAIKDGNLVDLRGYAIRTQTSLDNVAADSSDLKVGQLAQAVNDPKRNEIALKHWLEKALGRLTIGFAVNVEHAKALAELFVQAGIAADYVDGAMPREKRTQILERFRAQQIRVLFNCMIATEGFDVPEIGCVLIARPTKSRALYEQMVGRGTRTAPGKEDCIVLDLTDLTSKHDLATMPEITGLPSGIDLDGASTGEAREKLQGLELELSQLGTVRGVKLDELRSRAMEVQLYTITVPLIIQQFSPMRWLKIPGGYGITWERPAANLKNEKPEITYGQKIRVFCRVYQDELGWMVEYHDGSNALHPWTYGRFPALENAVRIGDRIVRHSLEGFDVAPPLRFTDQTRPATPAQLDLIRRLAQREFAKPDTTNLTAFEASNLINQLQMRPFLRRIGIAGSGLQIAA